MLVVRLEHHDPDKGGAVSELGRMVIANVHGDHVHADYVACIGEAGRDPHEILQTPQKSGQVHDHPRQSASAWTLVSKALVSVGFGRVKGRRET